MKHFLKAVPIPMCGLILGLASLGNLMKAFNFVTVGNVMGIVAGAMMLLILARILFLPLHSLNDLKNPIVASVAPTFTMALMVLCTYLTITPGLTTLAAIIWLAAVVILRLGLVLHLRLCHQTRSRHPARLSKLVYRLCGDGRGSRNEPKLLHSFRSNQLLDCSSLLRFVTPYHLVPSVCPQTNARSNLALDDDRGCPWFLVSDRLLEIL